MPRVRSMMKNTTAQNVDPERVEIASGYRMKTKPAPGIEMGEKKVSLNDVSYLHKSVHFNKINHD